MIWMTETSVKKEIKAYLRSIGGYITPIPGGSYGSNGAPDLVACVNGRFIAIEGKYDQGTQSRWQKLRQRQIEGAGGIYIVAYSVEDVRNAIEMLVL